MYRFRITDVVYTRHLIDSVGVTDSLITNIDFQRIKIFMRTSQGGDQDDSGSSDVSLQMFRKI